MLDVQVKISYDLLKISLLHYEKGAGAKCDHHKMKVRARSHLNLDVRGACVRRKKR